MDPVTTLQTVAAGFQLVSLARSIAVECYEIYRSNSAITERLETLDNDSETLKQVFDIMITQLPRIRDDDPSPKQLEQQLHKVAKECKEVTVQILDQVDALKLYGSRRRKRMPVQWIRVTARKGNIERLQGRLNECQGSLNSLININNWLVSRHYLRLFAFVLYGPRRAKAALFGVFVTEDVIHRSHVSQFCNIKLTIS